MSNGAYTADGGRTIKMIVYFDKLIASDERGVMRGDCRRRWRDGE